MAMNQNLPATDSAANLHDLIGDDSTATFENDPKFIDSTPGADGSSENLQDKRDREDVRSSPSLKLRDSDDVDEDDEDYEDDEDEDEDLDDEEDDEDEDLEDDEEDDDFEDDDEEYEDDEDEDEE